MAYVIPKRSTKKMSKSKSIEPTGLTYADLPVLRRKRTLALNRLRGILEVALMVRSDVSQLDNFIARYSVMEKQIDNFEEAHLDILSIVEDSDLDSEDKIRCEFDSIHFQLLALHRNLVPAVYSSEKLPTAPIPAASALRLPKIDLPRFSGCIKDFSMYLDSFNSLVHLNKSLSDSDRMQYLRASLSGDALGLIRTFPIQGEYYNEAYQTLVARYRDKRELAFTCWREMLAISLKISSPIEFRRALDLFNENLIILKSLHLPTESWDFVLCYQLLTKLDSKTRYAFEKEHPTLELPSYQALKKFLEAQCDALIRNTHFLTNQDSHTSIHNNTPKNVKLNMNVKKPTSSLLSNSDPAVKKPNKSRIRASVTSKCPSCSEDHSISHCQSFLNKSIQERRDIAKTNRWCFNCLKPSHTVRDCKSVFTCQRCHQRHHTLLHQEGDTCLTLEKEIVSEPVKVLAGLGNNSMILLSTAVIDIRDSSGNYQQLRCVIDTGSQAHFISERAVGLLGLAKRVTARQVCGVGQSSASVSGAVHLQIGINGREVFNIEAFTLPKICENMPSFKLDNSSWLHIRGLNLADPGYDKPGPIDLLLGAEIFPFLIRPGCVNGEPNQPSALNSVFGWLLMGNVNYSSAEHPVTSLFVSDDQLFQEIKKFWEVDSLPHVIPLSADDERCEQIYCDTTLPRLELCGCVLLADLLKFVLNIYQPFFPVSAMYAWSDSTVALSWIKSHSSRWKTFVANRVSHIQDAVPNAHWRHVASNDNPADIASRGQSPAELVGNLLWWAGPPWLSKDVRSWPCSVSALSDDKCRIEEKVQVLLGSDSTTHPIDYLLTRFSSIRKIQRIVGLWLHYITNLRCKSNRISDFRLKRIDMHNALLVIVKRTQYLHFGEDIKRLKEGRLLTKPMRKLSPFIDDQGVLRVGGRLSRSGLEYNHKHPALLPAKSELTYMIIDAMHRENCHPGINTMLYLVSQQFWILSAKRAIRHRVSKCLKCFKTNPTPLQPFMSDLPAVRVNQVKPFSIVGVDYGGPFRIKSGKHRGAKISKAYLCLFVCFTTKAVHLEVATDLSTESFIAALRRFVGRRGRVQTIFSDRGTNFVGAQRELSSYMQNATHSEHIEFKFNPPSSPHFGGVWEIQIKAVKSTLYRIIGLQCLTLEELFTLFVQIESMLNSRPLYSLSSCPDDLSVLTPGHFLTLEPLTAVPDEDLTATKISRLGRWQLIQRFQQDFWKRWKNEYLHSLIERAKWTSQSKPLEIGSVVIIKSDTPPLHWPLARVEELFSGPDGIVRVAKLRLPNNSFLTRPLTKVCPLPNQTD